MMNMKFMRSLAAVLMATALAVTAAPQTGISTVTAYAQEETDRNILTEVQVIHGTEKVSTLDNNNRRLDVHVLTSTGAGYVPAGNYTTQWLVDGKVVKEGTDTYWTKKEDAGKTITARVVFNDDYQICSTDGNRVTAAGSNTVAVTEKVSAVKSYQIMDGGWGLERYERVAPGNALTVELKDQDSEDIDPASYTVSWAEQKKNYGAWTDISASNAYTVTENNAGSILRATAVYNNKKYVMLVEVYPYLEGVHIVHGVNNVAGKAAAVGSRLQADPYKTNGDVVPLADFSIVWTDQDNNVISNRRTYTPTAADAGKTLTATVTFDDEYAIYSKDNEPVSTASAAVRVVDQLSIASIELSADAFTYNGEVQKPEVKHVLDENGAVVDQKNYTVSYDNADSRDNGTYTVTVTGRNTYKGTVSASYTIRKQSQAEPSDEVKTSVLYRLYNPNSGEHFFTAQEKEKNGLVRIGWKDEGTGWTLPEKSSTPVYRLYNPNAGEHHYTADEHERDVLIQAGWQYEGIAWYSDDNRGTAVYRLYNPNAFANNHIFTANEEERDRVIGLGWHDEGIGWYGCR